MTKTAAAEQAASESSMYRQGNGWIVSIWDEKVRCNRTSEERPYQVARQNIADYRRERIAELMAG